MMHRRPILTACLIVAIFATAVLGVPGGRVICVGEAGHLAIAGAHPAEQKHECCCEGEAAIDEGSMSAAESDCSDWSLDAQHLERPSPNRGDADGDGPTFNPLICAVEVEPLYRPVSLSTAPDVRAGGIPRAHLALIAPVVLLI